MIISKSDENSVSSNVVIGNQFTINASSKAFHLLSSMYSDTIKAIVREYSTNALDSHIAKGNKSPFHVHTPTQLEPFFYVQDFGIGLSDDDVHTMYTSYFTSTKTESNDYVGALGLGSKSAFAYTDSITVESVFDGKKTTYCAYIGEGGIPVLSKLTSIDTNDVNGFKITIPTKENDFRSFNNKIKKILSLFDSSSYTIINSKELDISCKSLMSVSPIIKSDDGKFVIYPHDHNHSSGCFAIQGNIEYPIDIKNKDVINAITCKQTLNIMQQTISYSRSLYIYFDIGELDFTPAREQLMYNKQTISNVAKKAMNYIKEMSVNVLTDINNSTSLFGAYKIYDKSIKVLQLKNNKNLKFKNKPIDFIDIKNKLSMNELGYSLYIGYNKQKKDRYNHFSIYKYRSEGYSLVINDKNQQRIGDKLAHLDFRKVIVIPEYSYKNKELMNILLELFDNQSTILSDIKVPRKNRNGSVDYIVTSAIDKSKKINVKNEFFGVYIPIKYGLPVSKFMDGKNDIINITTMLGISKDDFVLSNTYQTKYLKKKGWTHIDDFIEIAKKAITKNNLKGHDYIDIRNIKEIDDIKEKYISFVHNFIQNDDRIYKSPIIIETLKEIKSLAFFKKIENNHSLIYACNSIFKETKNDYDNASKLICSIDIFKLFQYYTQYDSCYEKYIISDILRYFLNKQDN